jgi:hypothetical protein
MQETDHPQFVPASRLPEFFDGHALGWRKQEKLNLGFGAGNDAYRLWSYPAPADDETMGIFFEWHTEDYFDVDSSPHVAIGLRGPLPHDPHRGRGLAIGILSSHMPDPHNPERLIALFDGCPPYPGGPAFFIEDFTINEGVAPARAWQFSKGRPLPGLQGHRHYRVDVHVSKQQVWAGVWMLTQNRRGRPVATFLDQTSCTGDMPASADDPDAPCPELDEDRGVGNAFIGTGFSDPETRSWIDQIFIAHWKNDRA